MYDPVGYEMKTIENQVRLTNAAKEKRSDSNEKMLWVGSLMAAVVASACCWLPLLLITLGVSGIGVSAYFERYRPSFMVLTFVFLAVAFYLTYRPQKKITKAVEEKARCVTDATAAGLTEEPETCCPPQKIAGFNVNRLNKVGLLVVTIIALAFVFFPNYAGFLLAGSSVESDSTVATGGEDMIITIEGMTCEACAAHVQSELEKVDGVVYAAVNYEEKKAMVTVDSRKIDNASLKKAVEGAGYKVLSFVSPSSLGLRKYRSESLR